MQQTENSNSRNRKKEKPSGEKSKSKQRRRDPESQGVVKKLPSKGKIVVPADMRNKKVSQLGGRQGNPSRVEDGTQLNPPHERIDVLFLCNLSQLQHRLPHTLLLYMYGHRHTVELCEGEENEIWLNLMFKTTPLWKM